MFGRLLTSDNCIINSLLQKNNCFTQHNYNNYKYNTFNFKNYKIAFYWQLKLLHIILIIDLFFFLTIKCIADKVFLLFNNKITISAIFITRELDDSFSTIFSPFQNFCKEFV